MATFPSYKPVYSASKTSQPKTHITRFNDGYEQRITFGLNQNPKQWALTFDVNNDDAAVIEAFLDARAADSTSFTWAPPDTTTTYKWVCETWAREMYEFERNKITATFRQVFEP